MTQSSQNNPGAGAPKPKRTPLRDRTFSITLTFPKAVFGVGFSLFLLIWVFAFGIMIGRGHNPEEMVPELAKVMPTPSSPENAATPGSDTALAQAAMNEVLPLKDLHYHDNLKGKGATEKPRPGAAVRQQIRQTPSPKAAASAKPATAHPKAQQKQQKTQQQKQSAKPAQEKTQQTTNATDQTVYNYIYQVAAFNNSAGAESMRKKLANGGIASKVSASDSNGTTWYRIMVSYTGRPEDTRKLREKLAGYGITNIILRGKAPVKRGRS